ncbi:peptidase S8 and S53 subtilisin kexin sedolisin [Roseivivax marinus]|uniref:Peptidase S8 and S53 subtilisin kexin sedolisin n=1 Tax=Roseivivax marinus TaxID=1379903 RepID=W4HII4_9RHOB|nr:hypothetical protein [Roseivivax marinus]ETW12504.1 peptidase S8 and S53 subtilisin kexin sedolisin [Roseivivax marinus]
MSNVYETTEAPSNTSTTYSIGINDQFRGTINSAYESDWVRIDLTGGTGYYFRMTGDGGPDSLAESELDLHNSDGVVYSSGPEGTVSLISASPRADGTFYLSASPGDVSYNTSALGDYVITPYAEIGNNLATTTTLAPGSSTTTAIDYAGDEDYFRVDVEAGSSYYIEMTGTSSGLVNRSRLELYGSEENYIGANDGQTARIVYTPERTRRFSSPQIRTIPIVADTEFPPKPKSPTRLQPPKSLRSTAPSAAQSITVATSTASARRPKRATAISYA